MESPAVEVYVAAFLARFDRLSRRDRPEVDAPGLHGLLPSADDPSAGLLVTDDRAYGALASMLPDIDAGMVRVFAAATRCTRLLDDRLAWRRGTSTAMTCADLRTLPRFDLPGTLALRPVRRTDGDAPRGVALADAVSAAARADPVAEEDPAGLTRYLRSLPPEVQLLAAVDAGGVVRGTSGFGAFGAYASVMFVNTDPGWRRQGIGRAMTSAALHAARQAGAGQAGLDASDAGRRIYLHLGFEAVAAITRFYREPASASGWEAAPVRPRR